MKKKPRSILKFLNIILGFCILLGVTASFAGEVKYSLGSIAETLVSGTDVVTTLMHFVCIAVGVALIISAISLFKAHQFNPKFVPLERPIIYVVLAIIIISVPFFGKIFGPTGSTKDYEKTQLNKKGVQVYDIDAPLDWGNDYDH